MAGTSDRWSQTPLQTTASSNNMDWMKTNQKDYSKFRYFLSGVDVTRQNLSMFTPYERGYARLFVYNMPVFMEKFFPELTKRFKSYLETGYRSVNGINDLSVEFTEYEGGFSGQKFSNVSVSHDDTDTITIGLYELAGSPVREFVETWITGVRDPRSGVAHYHGHVATPAHPADNVNYIDYAEKNHTMELIYFTTDATAKRIEYACLLAHCFPSKSDRDQLNYESNSHDTAEVELELRTTKYESRYINDIASFFLAADTIKYSYLDFNPFHDENGNQLSYQEVQNQVNTANSTFASSADATDTAWK